MSDQRAPDEGIILGIDLGTTFSAMAYVDRHGKPVAAIVPVEDLDLLERIEDRYDLEAARAALREPGPHENLEDLVAELGL